MNDGSNKTTAPILQSYEELFFLCTILVNIEKSYICLCPPEIDATTCHSTPARCSTTTSVVVLVLLTTISIQVTLFWDPWHLVSLNAAFKYANSISNRSSVAGHYSVQMDVEDESCEAVCSS